MTLKEVLVNEAATVYSITEKLFAQVSSKELLWTPSTGKNWMTIGQLMMHCANYGCGKAIQGFVRGDWGLPEGTKMEDLNEENHIPVQSELPGVQSVEEAFNLLENDKKLALNCIREVDETKLLNDIFVAPWGGPKFTLFQHLLHMIAHLVQHKGQLFYYLKLKGKNVNTSDLWGD